MITFALVCGLLGAVACTILALRAKSLNLGLFENIATGLVTAGLVSVALPKSIAGPEAEIAVSVLSAVLVMAAIGTALNARAR